MSDSTMPNRTVSYIHWTARAGFYAGLVVALSLGGNLPGWLFLAYFPYYCLTLLAIMGLILSCIALLISMRPSWRSGREFAVIGLVIGMLIALRLAAFYLHITL